MSKRGSDSVKYRNLCLKSRDSHVNVRSRTRKSLLSLSAMP